jgi:xeroderma pigmentosum group C-complementing protein
MKHALMRCGSRDVSAQLFTALCRALNIPARLVVSLQSVPWQMGVGKPKPAYNRSKTKKKEEPKIDVPAKDEGAQFLIGVSDPKGKGKAPAVHGFPGEGRRMDGGSSAPVPLPPPAIKLRKSKSGGRTLGSSSASPAPVLAAVPTKLAPADPTTTAPVFWTEVYSRPDARWIPVDPIRALVNKRRAFDPGPPVPGVRVENRMVYVLAVEEDGFARDVTARYARDYGARVAKLQGAPARGRRAWWERVCAAVQRPYRLQRDDVEDAELQAAQLTEAMPGTLAGFKDHPLYALARHVRRDEVVHPLVELGKFRGEPVYPRANVLSLKAPENWMRTGRVVKAGQQPMKYVPQRAVTVGRQRALEVAKEERAARGGEAGVEGGDEGIMQGLYAFGQTELYAPPPVVDVRISFLSHNRVRCLRALRLYRVKYRRMTLGTLTFMCHPCSQRAQCIFLVSFSQMCARFGYTLTLHYR